MQGALIAYATSPGNTATDGTGRNSPYTAQLLRHMRVPELPVERMFKVVRQGVQQETNGRQNPWESSSLTGEFYFSGRHSTEPVREHEPLELGGLSIIGRVSGAEVWVEDDKLGETTAGSTLVRGQPAARQLPRQSPEARLCSPGSGRCQVSADQRTDVAIDLTPLPGAVGDHQPLWPGWRCGWATTNSARPPPASALVRDNLPPGSYRVRAAEARLCSPGSGEVQVSADQRTEVRDRPARRCRARLAITSRVAGVEVWVGD